MHLTLDLFLTFLRIGLFTFGGGYAMISIIEHICVEQKKWLTHEDMMHLTIIAESTLGPMAVNCATFVGQKHGGFVGSAAATLGVVLPSFVIIYLISTVLDNFLEYPLVASAFQGIRIGVGVLILRVGISMVKKHPAAGLSRLIMAGAFCIVLLSNCFAWNFSTISLLVTAGALSLAVFVLRKGGGQT